VDNCITMNTLEHVYDPKFLIEELHRVLKKGGCVHITVPWMFRIHGHPDDFTRATPSWWRKTLEDAGFESAEITPLVWGRYCTAGTMTGYGRIFKKLSIHLAHLKDCLYAFVCFRGKGQNYSGKRAQRIYNVALGHFITARK
ncbi:MAG: class I SAM-dependent methyltransferase, partial [Alphaproteobacteria bacterium]